MGLMNEDTVLTPNIDSFARESLVFTNAISAFPLWRDLSNLYYRVGEIFQ